VITNEERSELNAAMDRYADGDNAAFGDVYDALAPRLIALFMRNVRDRSRAEDLVQQTLLQMHAARRNYKRGSDVLPWAYAIARNAMIDSMRKTRKELLPISTDAFDDALLKDVARDSVPDDIAQARQMAKLAQSAFEELPEAQRAAYELVRRDGLSIAETAEALGTTENAVKLRVHRVYEALRAILKS